VNWAYAKSRHFWKSPFFYLFLSLTPPSKYHHPPGFWFSLLILAFLCLPNSVYRTLETAIHYARNQK
jgi:hypothetical protein